MPRTVGSPSQPVIKLTIVLTSRVASTTPTGPKGTPSGSTGWLARVVHTDLATIQRLGVRRHKEDGLVVTQGSGEVRVGRAGGQKSPETPAGHQILGATFTTSSFDQNGLIRSYRIPQNDLNPPCSPATTYILTDLRWVLLPTPLSCPTTRARQTPLLVWGFRVHPRRLTRSSPGQAHRSADSTT